MRGDEGTLSDGVRRQLTRRTFLASALGAGGVMLLVACGPATQPAATSAPATAPKAPEAKPTAEPAKLAGKSAGGQIILSGSSEPLTLNPAFTPVSTTIYYSQLLFDGLTRPDDNLRPIPSLAESWQVSPDGLNYTFKLRKGVKFHDGKELTAADVKFTWEVIGHPSNKAGAQIYGFFSRIKGADAFRSGAAKEIGGVTTPDEYTVKVEMQSVYAAFLSISAFQPILPKHVYGAVPVEELEKHASARSPVGTGPGRTFLYDAPQIEEILVSGDLAVVRLIWTLRVTDKNAPGELTVKERGIDVFKRQEDGTWRIHISHAYPLL